jgi:hypothetical protein
MSSHNLISFSPVVSKSYEIALFNSSEDAFVKNSVNDWANLGALIKVTWVNLDTTGVLK